MADLYTVDEVKSWNNHQVIEFLFKHQFFDCIGPFRDHHIDGNAFMTLDMPTLKYLDISDKSARNLSTIVASIAIAKPVKHEYGRESLISKFFSAIIHKSKKSNVNRKRVKSTELPSAISEYDRNSISSAPGEVLELSNSETNSLYEEIDQPDVEAIEVDSQLYDQLVYKYPEASLDGPIQLEIDESDLEQNVIIRSNKGHDAKIRLSTMDNTKDEDAHIYSQIPQEYERMSLKPKSYQDDYLYVVGNEDVKATQNLNKAQSNTYENHSVQALQNLSAKISPVTGYLKQETGKTAGGERKKNQIFNEVIKPSKEAPRRLKKKATVIIKRMQKYEQQVDENKSNLATAQAKSMAGSLHNSPPARKTRQLTEQVDSKLVKPLRQQLTGQLEKRSSEKSADAIFTDTSKSKANPTFEKGQSNLNKKTLPEVDPGHNNVASSPFILKDQRFVNQNYPSRDEKVPKQTNQGLELLKNAKSAISPSSALDNAHQSQKKLDSQRITPKRVAKSDNLSNSPIVASPIAVSKKPVTGKVKALAQNLIGGREELNQATNIRQPSEQTNKLGSASPQSSRKFITTTFQSSNQEHFTPKKAAFSPTTHATNDSKINKNKARPKGIHKGDFDRYNDGNTSNTAKEDYDDITEATTDPSSVHHHADLDVHNLSELEDHSWYHSNLTRQEAEEKLSKYVKNGTFLVRNGQQSNNYVLSIIVKKSVAHIRILCRPEDEKYILGERKQHEMPFNSVPELIAFYHAEQMVLMSGHQVFLTKSCSY